MKMVAPDATAKEWPLELNERAVAFERLSDAFSVNAFLHDLCLDLCIEFQGLVGGRKLI